MLELLPKPPTRVIINVNWSESPSWDLALHKVRQLFANALYIGDNVANILHTNPYDVAVILRLSGFHVCRVDNDPLKLKVKLLRSR